ncbi:response regulator transcription factor [Roseicella aquatilis]|uniref:Response regulator transcription factor n=1 Tax=Roseicella aquatilis TaxID=2527868 RepID=A0A4R4D2C9_9PROT|nr:response regulator transcription factor [Roseicella aquatilis]TCZ52756.1 response regulator transcription factor [Roseicella aquatilis]
MTRLLLVEDDLRTAAEITAELEELGYAVAHATDGATGLGLATRETFDVLVVDRMLPGIDGLSLIRALRERRINTPALVLSALGAVDDRIKGLRAGGDDYLVKPFSLGELAARLEALLRRRPDAAATLLRAGPLEIDLLQRRATCGGRGLDLLARELQLLEYLMRHEGQVVTRAMLLEDVWKYRFPVNTNLVDVHLGRLRRKLEDAYPQPLIHTVRGTGFVLRASP